MKNSFFISIYLIVLFIILVIQSFKIKQLKENIKEADRLKKEIYKLGDTISLIDNKQEVYDFILNTAIKVIQKGDKGNILVQDKDGLFRFKTVRGFSNDLKLKAFKKEELKLYQYNGCKDIAIINSKVQKEDNNSKECVLASPINSDGKLIGIINIYAGEGGVSFTEDDINSLRYIRHELELAIKNFFTQDRLKHIAIHDELTNLHNRRSFNQLFDKEIEDIKINNTVSYLALIDLDDFKFINDTYGHKAGDTALVQVAEAMKKCLGAQDSYARISGDEFVIIFRGGTLEQAEDKLGLIREDLKLVGRELKVNFTYGLVCINSIESLEKDEIFSAADRKMYMEKKRKKVGR